MLILPPGHARALSVPRRLRVREKWMVGGVLGAIAALIVVVAISLLSAGHSTANGCVDVTIPGSLGGQELYRCGAAAREMCQFAGTAGGYTANAGRAVAVECRKAGLRVGS